jgi:polyribonucleotide nucleotidyltransferase
MKREFEIEIGGRKLKWVVSDWVERANGACFLSYGETEVLSTATISDYEKEEIGFFPLTVDYEERYYAAGKIRGPRYIKREGRPSDEAICNARLIDRTIRPLFPKNLKREVQVVVTVLSWDEKNEPSVPGILATSLSLLVSEIPWQGPVAAVRVGKIGSEFVLNPTYEEREKSKLDLVFAGVERNGEILINMIEGSFQEAEEEEIFEAFNFAKENLKILIDFQKEIARAVGKEKIPLKEESLEPEIMSQVEKFLEGKIEKGLFEKKEGLEELRKELENFIEENFPEKSNLILDYFEEKVRKILHQKIIEEEKRPDGRKLDEIREIFCQVGVLPRTHGSAFFSRGQTKSLSILTLGAPGDVQLLEGMEITGKKRFMHHYNFPPYSVGEIRPIRGPGRREIGHGVLAEKALLPLIPSFDEFPYTIRVVSEILSSNGSTSMAAVSSSSLALMDAGVPIKRLVSGIALGLMFDEKMGYRILTDIQGPEDRYGDLDFKIAGTEKGVTAIQMDVKIDGISEEIFLECLKRGKRARLEILEKMKKVIEKPRPELSPFAPRVLTIQINPEKIREVIGPGGRMINEIISECGVSIDIEESGRIFVTAEKEEAAKKAIAWIKNITREIKVGEVFQGKVKRILNFGAMIEILPGQEGLLHSSQFGKKRGEISQILKVGELIPVKVISIDSLGRINLGLTKKYGKKRRF